MEKIEQCLKHLRVADVELFITAAHLKSLGKSASLHHLSQSAASSAILRVEQAFKKKLCTHKKRHFELTREGRALLGRLEQWLKGLKELFFSEDTLPLKLVTTYSMAQIAVPLLFSKISIHFQPMRPDAAYDAILQSQADMALVLDNAPWKGVEKASLGQGYFQLYARQKEIPIRSVLLPEDQIEVVFLQQSWVKAHGEALSIKARIPSWSLIAQICAESDEVGFLPDFLAKKLGLYPVSWQPAPSAYQVLAIHRKEEGERFERFQECIKLLTLVFGGAVF